MLVAVHANDLFREIGIPVHVVAIAGNLHRQRIPDDFGFEIKSFQNTRNFRIRNGDPKQRVDLRNACRHFTGREVCRAHVAANIRYHAATKLFNKVQCARHAERVGVGVHPLFKTCGRIGGLPQSAGRFTYVVAGEFRRLEKYVFGRRLNFAVESAHNPRKCNGLFAVANHEIVFRKRKFLFIERNDLFALLRTAHDNLSIPKIVRVKRVHGLSHFQQHEIGDIDDG